MCPGPYPVGGNCVWWAWEQWHLLGYNLPLNWGNAADWIVDAERSGLPLGTMPRVGSIAVFPRADGVWAFGPAGHVAFVTAVSSDASTFNVTYQNYGDPTPMYVGTDYNVSVINQPRFQNGSMRFLYFPRIIDPQRFAHLPGIGNSDPVSVTYANSLLSRTLANNATGSSATFTGDRIALGLSPVSSDQEFNADFAGNGVSDLLLYDRLAGRLDVLTLARGLPPYARKHVPGYVPGDDDPNGTYSQTVSLGDSITPAGKWGSNLDVHIGDFAGTGEFDILLYDHVTGTIQLLSLTPDLAIKKHVTLPGYGPGWELYVGRFDGKRSGVFMYNRFARPDLAANSTPAPTKTFLRQAPTATPRTKTKPPTPTPKPSPTPNAYPNSNTKPIPTPTVQRQTANGNTQSDANYGNRNDRGNAGYQTHNDTNANPGCQHGYTGSIPNADLYDR